MINRVFKARRPKPKRIRLTKVQIDFIRYVVSLSVLASSITTLFLSWGAMEIEEYANRQYDIQPKYNTENTCLFSKFYPEINMCTRVIKDEFHSFVAFAGIRLDCALSSPLIIIALCLFWQDSYSKWILLIAHICGWTKSISIAAAVTCVLIDDPSFMREVFEKSRFGTYESKLLYSFTMASISVVANIFLLIALSFAPCVPDKIDSKYFVRSQQASQYKNCRVCPATARVTSKKSNVTSIAVVEDIFRD